MTLGGYGSTDSNTAEGAARDNGIQKVNKAIEEGGESYFRYRQIEMFPHIAPAIAKALGDARMVTISSGGLGAPETATNNMVSVIQTVLAAQMVGRGGLLELPKPEDK